MPNLQPTLVIGLGSTGLHVLDYLRQFLFEEYGQREIPVIQLLAFETNRQARSSTGLRLRYITVPDVRGVNHKLQALPEDPAVQGYKTWLPPQVLRMGDSFEDGAGGVRAAGRLILWENWAGVRSEIKEALDRCTSPDSKNKTIQILQRHFEQNEVGMDPNQPLVTDDAIIFVVGTLCGGSCSGMFTDLGYLLRTLSPNTTRILTVSMLTSADANDPRMMMPAANNYGALVELDFLYHQMPANAYSYKLPDGITDVVSGELPYKLVYLVSNGNPTSRLKETGINQMMAMNLFLDIVGSGRSGKDGAIADLLTNVMAQRSCDAQGMVKYFYSFGLSTVWYPKSKITGLAACELGISLINAWLDAPENLKPSEIKAVVQADYQVLEREIINDISTEVSLRLKNIEMKDRSNVVRDFSKRLDEAIDQELLDELIGELKKIDERIGEIASTAGEKLRSVVDDQHYSHYKNMAMTYEYWSLMKALIAERIAALPDGPQVPPRLDRLDRLRRCERAMKKDWWVWLVGLRKQAIRYYRGKYVDAFVELWRQSVLQFAQNRLKTVLRMLRGLESDREVMSPRFRQSMFQQIDEALSVRAATLADVRNGLQSKKQVFEALGGSVVVHEVFLAGASVQADVNANKRQIRENNSTPPAESVQFHLQRIQEHSEVRRESQFWAQESTHLVDIIVENYQQEGLKHLPRNLADASDSVLQQLSRNAEPYQSFNHRLEAVYGARDTRFIFGGASQQRLGRIAETIEFPGDGNQVKETGLRHMLFLYREARCLAVDALEAFDVLKFQAERARDHPYTTHRDPSFFDFRRVENRQKSEQLLDSAYILFRGEVFEKIGNDYLFSYSSDGQPVFFDPGKVESFERMARTTGATDYLEQKVRHALSKRSYGEYVNLYNEKYKELEEQVRSTTTTEVQRQELQRRQNVLTSFHATLAQKFYT